MCSSDQNFKQLAIPFVIFVDFKSLIKNLERNSEKDCFKPINNSI